MFEKAKPARDAFTFSLGGMAAKSSFVIAPAIASDRINKIRDERLRNAHEDQPETARGNRLSWGRFWLRARRQAA
jgi:hypothetical protein